MKSPGGSFVWKGEGDRSAGQEDERERGFCGVEPVGAPDDQFALLFSASARAFAEIQAAGGEDALAVFADRFAEADERCRAGGGPGGPAAGRSAANGHPHFFRSAGINRHGDGDESSLHHKE